MKTILKCLLWAATLIVVALAIVYCMYLILIFWLFSYELQMYSAIGAMILLFIAYWKLINIAECA